MLRTKASALRLVAVDLDSGAQTFVRPEMYLSKNQRRRVGSSPEFVLQFARIVRDDFAAHGKRVAIHARKSLVSLNGGRYYPLIDANTDLAQAEWRHFGRDPWVLDRPR